MKGLLAKAEQQGRYGDSLLAHITPEEAALLKRMGGAGTRNPRTGLLEFWTGEGDTDNGAGPGVATSVGENQGPDGGDGGGNGVAPGSQAMGLGQDVANAADAVAVQAMGPSVFGIDTSPAAIARSVMGLAMGPMSPSIANMAAQVIGQGINAVTGATNEGAVQGQAAVGMGGPAGDAGQNGGGPSFDTPPGSVVAPPPPPVVPPPVPQPLQPPGLLAIQGTRRPYGVTLQNPNLRRGLLA